MSSQGAPVGIAMYIAHQAHARSMTLQIHMVHLMPKRLTAGAPSLLHVGVGAALRRCWPLARVGIVLNTADLAVAIRSLLARTLATLF